MKIKQLEVVVILTEHKIQCGTEDRNVSAQARYIFSRDRARPAELEQICGEPASRAVDLQAMRSALTLYLQNKWPNSIDERGHLTILGRLDDCNTWVFQTGSAKKVKPLPKPKWKSGGKKKRALARKPAAAAEGNKGMQLRDDYEKDMTKEQAQIAARKLYGKNFGLIKDYWESSPEQRLAAKREFRRHMYILKSSTDVPPKVRHGIESLMHSANKLSTYYQYKIGTIGWRSFDFSVFTMYVEGDSWNDCFRKLKIQSEDKKREKLWGVSGDGTFHDKSIGS